MSVARAFVVVSIGVVKPSAPAYFCGKRVGDICCLWQSRLGHGRSIARSRGHDD